MIIKDCQVQLETDFGLRNHEFKGYREFIGVGSGYWSPFHGRNACLRDLNNRKFVMIGDEIIPVTAIRRVQIIAETEREVPEPK